MFFGQEKTLRLIMIRGRKVNYCKEFSVVLKVSTRKYIQEEIQRDNQVT